MTEETKNKWTVNVWTTGRVTIEHDGGHPICEVHPQHNKEQMPNARLMAAAPALLDACENAVKNHLPYEDESGYFKITLQDYAEIVNAIANAKEVSK